MKSLIRYIARLYPTAWCARYGDEFDALLDDSKLRWRDVPDVLFSAIRLQRPSRRMVAFAFAGLILGAVLVVRSGPNYVATATATLTSADILPNTWTRSALSTLIQEHNLYEAERQRMPMEDVIERLRRDIRVSRTNEGAARIQFRYTEPGRAQKAVHSLARLLSFDAKVDPDWQSESRSLAPLLWGLAAGLVLGFVSTLSGRTLGAGALSMTLALAIAFSIPSRYHSSMVVRADSQLIREIAANTEGVKIQRVSPTAVTFSFTDTDRAKSQQVLKEISGEMRKRSWGQPERFTMIDPPSLPQSPVSPNRLTIALMGLVIGLLAGAVTSPRGAQNPVRN